MFYKWIWSLLLRLKLCFRVRGVRVLRFLFNFLFVVFKGIKKILLFFNGSCFKRFWIFVIDWAVFLFFKINLKCAFLVLFKIFCKVLRLICLFFFFKEKESLMFRVKCNFFKMGLNLKKIDLLFFINKGIFLW